MYKEKWEKRFQNAFSLNDSNRSDDEIQEFRSLQLKLDPIFYRYNDILGFVELELGGNDILVYYHFNGDLRKKYNKGMEAFRNGKKSIYPSPSHVYGSSFEIKDNYSIREAIIKSMEDIKEQCFMWNVIIDIEPYKERINYFDFEEYFSYKNWL